jgi:acetyl esterase/lipase
MTRAALAILTTAFAFTPRLCGDSPQPKVPLTADGFYEVEVIKNQAYRDGKDADTERHKLDLYLPKGVKDFPMMMFVHGGAWKMGSKELYGPVGAFFARNGVGTAVINYRLSGKGNNVRHPDHIQDVAKAFAWLHANAGKHRGREDRMFIAGHSAGAHLVALLGTDGSYLAAEKLSLADIHGVMALSGVYTIMPLVPIFHQPFGKDEEICKLASPIYHVKGKHPPFLIAYADADFPTCDKMSDQLCAKLNESKCEAVTCKVPHCNHFTIMFNLVKNEKDPCTQAMFEFIGKHSDWQPPTRK